MTWFDEREIAKAAKKHAEKIWVDEEKARAFSAGVEWTLDRFFRMLSIHPLESGSTKKMCDGFRLKDFQELVDKLSARSKGERER